MIELLPIECWYIILGYLDTWDIDRLLITCRSWYYCKFIPEYIRMLWNSNFLIPMPKTTPRRILKLWTTPDDFPFRDIFPLMDTGTNILCQLKFTNWYRKSEAIAYQELPIYKEIEVVIDKLRLISNIDNSKISNVRVKTVARNALLQFSELLTAQTEQFNKNWSIWLLLSNVKGCWQICTTSESVYNIYGLFDSQPAVKCISLDRDWSDAITKSYPLTMDAIPKYYADIVEMELTGKFPDGFSVSYTKLPTSDDGVRRLPRLSGIIIESADDIFKFFKALSICGYHAKMKLS